MVYTWSFISVTDGVKAALERHDISRRQTRHDIQNEEIKIQYDPFDHRDGYQDYSKRLSYAELNNES